jgi:RND family efflux transporter MFP subunit
VSKLTTRIDSAKPWFYLLGGIALIMSLLVVFNPEPSKELRDIPPLGVVLAPVQAGSFEASQTYAGRLTPIFRAELRFEVAGQIGERLAEPGEMMEKGDVLLRLKPGDYRPLLTEAESSLQQEEASISRDKQLLKLASQNAALQKAEVDRLRALGEKNLTSKSQLDAASQQLTVLRTEVARLRYIVETAESRLAAKKAGFERAANNLDRTELRAPFAGRVNIMQVNIGDYVNSGQVAAEMVDDRQFDLVLHIPGHVAEQNRLGGKIPVTLNEAVVLGSVISLQVDPDPSTFTHELRIRLPEGIGRSGALARAELITGRYMDVLAVPVPSVLNQDGQQLVFVYREGQLEQRAVEILQRIDDLMLLRSGVNAGERIVARDVAALSDGVRVAPVE